MGLTTPTRMVVCDHCVLLDIFTPLGNERWTGKEQDTEVNSFFSLATSRAAGQKSPLSTRVFIWRKRLLTACHFAPRDLSAFVWKSNMKGSAHLNCIVNTDTFFTGTEYQQKIEKERKAVRIFQICKLKSKPNFPFIDSPLSMGMCDYWHTRKLAIQTCCDDNEVRSSRPLKSEN